MAVLPSARRFENRRQVASGNLPQSSSDSKARNLRSHRVASRLSSEAVGAGTFRILLCDATMHSSNLKPYLDFPAGKKLTIFSPSLIRAINLGRGTVSICAYQRSTSSVKSSISFSRLLATGLMAGSSAASKTQARSASTAGSISRSLRRAAIAEDRHPPDQIPGQQLLDRIGDVGSRHAERLGDILGRHRRLGEIEQAV